MRKTEGVSGLVGRRRLSERGLTRDKLVPSQTVVQTCAKEDIGLVEEQHGVPQPAELQRVGEGGLDNFRAGTEHACADEIQGDPSLFGNYECLSGP